MAVRTHRLSADRLTRPQARDVPWVADVHRPKDPGSSGRYAQTAGLYAVALAEKPLPTPKIPGYFRPACSFSQPITIAAAGRGSPFSGRTSQ